MKNQSTLLVNNCYQETWKWNFDKAKDEESTQKMRRQRLRVARKNGKINQKKTRSDNVKGKWLLEKKEKQAKKWDRLCGYWFHVQNSQLETNTAPFAVEQGNTDTDTDARAHNPRRNKWQLARLYWRYLWLLVERIVRRDVLAAADGHLALPLASVARLAHALGLVPAVAAAAAAPLSDTTNPSASVPIEHKKTLPSKRKKKQTRDGARSKRKEDQTRIAIHGFWLAKSRNGLHLQFGQTTSRDQARKHHFKKSRLFFRKFGFVSFANPKERGAAHQPNGESKTEPVSETLIGSWWRHCYFGSFFQPTRDRERGSTSGSLLSVPRREKKKQIW